MAAICGEGKIFWKLPRVHFLDTPWIENFDEIDLSRTVKEIEAILCFTILGKNSKIQNGRHMWEEENFLKLPRVHCSDTPWVENFDEIPLSHTVKEIEAILCFAIFGEGKFFWKLPRVHWSDTLLLDNFDEIALSRMVKEIECKFVFCHFWQKFENSKWSPFLGRGHFFEIAKSTLLGYPVGRIFRRNRSVSHG